MDTTEIRLHVADANEARSLALRLLVDLNVQWLRAHRSIPLLYRSRVVYRTSPCSVDTCIDDPWVDVVTALSRGFADCKSLVAWRIAELLVRNGEVAHAVWTQTRLDDAGATLFHVQVRRRSGQIEDPSALLGMTSLTG